MSTDSEAATTRVVIADDHPLILATLDTLLAGISEVQVVARVRSAEELIDCLASTRCDLLVTDYSMPGDFADGLSLIRGIRRDYPLLPIAVVTMMANSAVHIALMKSGVLALVDKASDVQDVVAAVQAVRRGRDYVSPSFRAGMAKFPKARAGRRLTPREAEVFRLLVSGLSVSAVAERCARSVKTISRQKLDGMKKLGLKSDVELFEYAREHGLG